MIITLNESVTDTQRSELEEKLAELKLEGKLVQTQSAEYMVAIGNVDFDIRKIGHLDAVKDVHRVSDPFKLVSRKWRPKPTEIKVTPDIAIREGDFSVIAGPCSVESEQTMQEIAEKLSSLGVKLMRGGAYKPRTSPYSFRGHGLEGLKMFHEIARAHGMAVVTEVVSASHIEDMFEWVDIFQVGTRNSQNFDLLHELGAVDKPVLLKRGMSGTLDELLQSAEYIYANGNEKILLCERGIRTFEKTYRNTFDINAIPALNEKTHLPLIADPSHGVGLRRWVPRVALAAAAAGADGMIVEVHTQPEKALSDGQQTLNMSELEELLSKVQAIREVLR